MKTEQIPYFLAWHRAVNLTNNRFNLLQKTFQGDWKKSWETTDKFFLELDFDSKFKEKLSLRAKVSPEKENDLLQNCGAKIITNNEDNFPLPLKHIPNPPPFLFFRGKFSLQDFPALAVVGSRKLSAYGKQAMFELLSPLTNLGVTIVSGLALGTDAEAHRLALQGKSRTIAVLGSGIDKITPYTNLHLGEKILEENRGAIISEYLPNTETQAAFFPVRNRIVSGLAKTVLIVEAEEKSGSLITAQIANEQGRDAFVIPGSIFSPLSAGTNQCLSKGEATALTNSQQLLESLDLGEETQQSIFSQENPINLLPRNEIENDILQCFSKSPQLTRDEIIRQLNHSTAEVQSTLSIMEIKGFLRLLPPDNYFKNC